MTVRWFDESDRTAETLLDVIDGGTDPACCPSAASVTDGVPIYDVGSLRADGALESRSFLAEVASVLLDGPGIVVFEGAVDLTVIERATAAFHELIESERDQQHGDHFAAPGENDRVWNALEKLCRRNPEVFAEYYENDVIAAASRAWLGPGYQITSQLNVVNPGGRAQVPHRDYHLGFMSQAAADQYPSHVHELSAALTLQGAIAHCDMPIETGPTVYLPHSQKMAAGYLAWHDPEIQEVFAERHVQLPLRAGDAVFFSPALLHGAGENRTSDVRRMANLLQISSAFGRAMETVDRRAMVLAVYPVLQAMVASGSSPASIDRVISATAEGYPFPADLDVEHPTDGLVPESDAVIVRRALDEGWSTDALSALLR